MRHVRMLGLCVIALLGLAAVAAAGSASAASPEWGVCVEQKKGHYEDSNCSKEKYKESKGVKKYSGKYEWKAGAPAAPECIAKKHGNYLTSACNTEKEKKGVPEEGKGKYEKIGPKFVGVGGAGVLRTMIYVCAKEGYVYESTRLPHENCNSGGGFVGALGVHIECSAEHATGEAVGSNEITNVSVLFTGCSFQGVPAQTPGLKPGEIQVNTLKGHLGYINKAGHEVGVLLEPAVAGGKFVTFEILAGEALEHVGVGNATEGAFYEETPGSPTGHDGVISPIVPVDQMTRAFTQNYRIEKIQPYEPVSCRVIYVSHTCPHGSKGLFAEEDADFVNIPSHFEGGQLEALEVFQDGAEGDGNGYEEETSQWDPAGQEITNVNTVEGEAEIKA